MNGILIIFIITILIFFIYKKLKKKIFYDTSFKLGVIKNDKNIIKYGELIKSHSDDNINLHLCKNYDELMEMVNSGDLDFGITYENYFVDTVLGLHNYEKKISDNIEFCTGIYFNYFQILSSVFTKGEENMDMFTSIKDFMNFKKIYKRNVVIGTESFDSISFINLFLILILFDFKPINFNKYDEKEHYEDNIVFYYIDTEENLKQKMIVDKIDMIFLFRTINDSTLNYIKNNKDTVNIYINFDETYFDKLFSLYYFKTNLLKSTEEFVNTTEISYETRMSRVVFISNKNVNNDIIYTIMKYIYTNNNYLTNLISNNNDLEKEHNYFEPIDIAYVNKNIPARAII